LKISIITATYNSSEFLEHSLISLHSQNYKNFEHIVIDGMSTDSTLDILNSFKIKHIISEPDDGIYYALNKGISLATGDIIGFLHADDFFASYDVLSSISNAFIKNTKTSAVYGDLAYVKRSNIYKTLRYWKSNTFSDKLLSCGWMPPHPCLYVRREFFNKFNNFDIQYKISSDYNFILELFSTPNVQTQYIPKLFIKMRAGGTSNKSLLSIARKSKEDWKILSSFYVNPYIRLKVLICKNFSKVQQFLPI
jgi:glycosyltransferase